MEQARERAASIAILTSIPMVGQLIAGRAVRDTLFLTEYDAVYLPRVFLAAAVLSLAAAMAVGRLMPKWGPRATAVALAAFNGMVFVLEAALVDLAPRPVAVLTYVHVSVVGALIVSAFSSVVNERFDPHYAKTVVAQVGTGAALGGVLGGVLAVFLADTLELSTVLYGLGAISLLIALGMWNIGRSRQPGRSTPDETQFGVRTIRDDSYLRRVAFTVVLLGIVGVLVDYAMKAEADARFSDSAGLLSFFAAFYMTTSLLTFVMQAGVARPLLEKIGLGGTMAVLPFAVAVSAGLGAVLTGLWTAALTRGTQTVVSSSLFRSGYELLYTPVAPLKKRATKALIDIACNRVGYGIGSVFIMVIVAFPASGDLGTPWVLAVATAFALISAWMIRRLNDGYVHELATSLREGSIVLEPVDVIDATTAHTLAESVAVMNRHQLLDRIEALGRENGADQTAAQRETWAAQLSDLLSDDPRRVLKILMDESLSPHLARQVIDRLGDPAYAHPARRALERMGRRITGQLVDTLLAHDSPVAIRRRVPRLLGKIEDPRAVWGLLEGLGDEEAGVRDRCGRALADLQRANDDLVMPEHVIMEAIEREASVSRDLQHVFTLLGLVFDRDAMLLSLKALTSHDTNLRGTALEYLHNVLPGEVRKTLWPRLTEHSEPRQQATKVSPEELLKSMQSLMLDRGEPGK